MIDEERIKKILSNAKYTSYNDPNTREISRNNGLLAYQICLMEDILAKLTQLYEIKEVPYKDSVTDDYFGPGD